MTKTLKKSFIVILMLVTSLFFGFAFGTANSASADGLTNEENKFISDVNTFIELADTDHDGALSIAEITAVKGTADADTKFISMYTFISNSDTGNSEATYVAAKSNYQMIYTQYNIEGAVDFYSTLATTIRNIYTVAGSSYKQHTAVESARTEANKFSGTGFEKDLAFLKNSDLPFTDSGDYEDLFDAEAKISYWKTQIDNAIIAIKEIKVYVVQDPVVDAMTTVWDSATNAYLTTYEVLWGSKNTVEAARTAANIVIEQDDIMYISTAATSIDGIDHYSILTNAENTIAIFKQSVDNVIAKINAAKAEYKTEAGKEVCYTIYESLIKPADEAYKALAGADYNNNGINDNLNNLKDGVTNISDLNSMLFMYSTVQTAINGVLTKIAAIGSVKYDNTSKQKIKEARDAFDALPNDVKVHDNAEGATEYCVSNVTCNYGTLLDAEKVWADYVSEVNALIASIKNLRTVETTEGGINIFKEFGKTQDLYNGLSDKNNQLKGDAAIEIIGVEPTSLDASFRPEGYLSDITNCKDSYLYYQNLSNKINTATKDIIKNINTLYGYYDGLVRFTNDFNNVYTAIVNAIAGLPKIEETGELDPRYKGAINNYDTFVAMDTKYKALVTAAETWIDSIVAIVSVNTFDAVETSKTNFAAIVALYLQDTVSNPNKFLETDLTTDLAAFNRLYNSKMYSAYYTAYTQSVNKKAEIIGKLAEIKDAVAEGTLVRPLLENALDTSSGNAAYKGAVKDVTARYNNLSTYDDTSVEGYITTAKYFETNENYSASYALYKAALINDEAHAIEETIAKITSNSTDNVDYISAARTAYDAPVADGVCYTKEEVQAAVRNTATLTAAETAVKGFVDGVKALLENASYTGTDVDAVDTAVIDDDTLILGIYKLDVTAAKSLKAKYDAFSNVYKAYAADGFVVGTANTLLDSIIERVGNKTTGKLKYIEEQLEAFINQYTAGTSVAGRYEKLDEFVNALTASQQALLDKLGDFQQIQRDKVVAEQLGEAIKKLLSEVDADKITNETVIDYYVINSIFENMNPSQKALVSNINGETAADVLAGIKTDIDAAVATSNGVVDISETLKNLGTQLGSTMSELEGQISSLETTLTALINAKTTLQNVKDNIDNVLENSTLLSSIDESIEGLEGDISELTTSISTLNGRVDNIDGQITTINGTLNSLTAKDSELAALIDAITKEGGTLETAIAAAKEAIEAAYKSADAELKSAIELANKAIADEITNRENAITKLQKALDDAIAAEQEARDAAVKNEATKREEAINAEKAERENAVKAEQEARAEETKSLNNAIVTITIIFSIVLVALVACVVVLFLKARKA